MPAEILPAHVTPAEIRKMDRAAATEWLAQCWALDHDAEAVRRYRAACGVSTVAHLRDAVRGRQAHMLREGRRWLAENGRTI